MKNDFEDLYYKTLTKLTEEASKNKKLTQENIKLKAKLKLVDDALAEALEKCLDKDKE